MASSRARIHLLATLLSLAALTGPVDTIYAQSHAPACNPAPQPPPTLDLNRATEQELQRLPRIGPARARAIVRTRERLGGFRRISQLLRVRGIGRATLRLLRPLVTLGPPLEPGPQS